MATNHDPVSSLVDELKGNAGFLNKMLFPKISLIVGTIGILITIVILVK